MPDENNLSVQAPRNMIVFSEPLGGVFSVMTLDELQRDARQWEIVAVLSVPMGKVTEVEVQTHDGHSYPTRGIERTFVGVAYHPRLLVRQPTESALNATRDELVASRKDASDLRAALADSRREAEELTRKLLLATNDQEEKAGRITWLEKQQGIATDRYRKVERDLGRVREQLGAQRMREIVGDSENA